MIITDPRQPDNPIVYANDAFLGLTGYSRDEVMGSNCRFLQGPETDQTKISLVRAAIEAEADISVDLLNYKKNGSTFWNALYLSPVRNEAGELVFFFASQLDVTERTELHKQIQIEKDVVEHEVARRTLQLREALEAKTVLLHEVDHRVKNNLQMISSLIYMQSREVHDPEAKQSLARMQERIEALGTVHQRLYQSGDVTRFDIAEFVRDLVPDLMSGSGRDDIAVDLQLSPVDLPAEKAASAALMINELLTNVLKHAFGNRPGRLQVAIARLDDDFRITVEDDGVGMPAAILDGGGNFGTRLVAILARQLQARIQWLPAHPGTRVEINLPIDRRAGSAA